MGLEAPFLSFRLFALTLYWWCIVLCNAALFILSAFCVQFSIEDGKTSDFSLIPESVKLKNQISSKVSLQAKNKAKSSHSKCTQKVHENWKTPVFYAIIEVDKSGIGYGKNEL